MYRAYRRRAGLGPERAAELLNISAEGLKKWENGERRCPCDAVPVMTEIYAAPELLVNHLADRCPIWSGLFRAVDELTLTGSFLRYTKELGDVVRENERLLNIVCDGAVSPEEQDEFTRIVGEIDELLQTGMALRLVSKTVLRKATAKAA